MKKYFFALSLVSFLAAPAMAEFIQCDHTAIDGMSYLLVSGARSKQGIIISKNSSKGGKEIIISTKAKVTSGGGIYTWDTYTKASVDWTLPENKDACQVYVGDDYSFFLKDPTDALNQGQKFSGTLMHMAHFENNPNISNCRNSIVVPPPQPFPLTCQGL